MDYYLTMLQKSISKLEAEFKFNASIEHNGSKGAIREFVVKEFLRPYLPKCYGVASGQAFDTEGQLSKQLDIVLFDDLYSYLSPYTEDFIYFPCESVYGVIEVKSKLNKTSFIEAVENIRSLKKLKRDKVDTYHINPMKDLRINNVSWNIETVNEYLGVVFAYESVAVETILSYFDEIVVSNEDELSSLPNMIVLFDKKTIIYRFKHLENEKKFEVSFFKEFNGYMALNFEEDILASFLLDIFVMLRCIDLKALDIKMITEKVNKKCLSNTVGVIPHKIFK